MEWRILPTCEAMRLKDHGLRNKLACGGVCGPSDIRRTAASEMERSEIELGMAGLRVDDKLRNKLACGGVCGSSDIRRAAASEMTPSGIEPGMAGLRVDDIFHPNRIFLSALPFLFSAISYIIGKTGILFP